MGCSILALDVASVTGWCFGVPGSAPTASGSLRFAEQGADDPRVWSKAMVWLTQQINGLSPSIVYIEAPITSASPAGGSNAATMSRLIGLQAVLRAVVELKLPVSAKLVHVQSARKLFIGAGNLPGKIAKERVQQRCIDLGWIAPEDAQPDRCDAMCVWAFAAAQHDPEFAAQFVKPRQPRRKAPAVVSPEMF